MQVYPEALQQFRGGGLDDGLPRGRRLGRGRNRLSGRKTREGCLRGELLAHGMVGVVVSVVRPHDVRIVRFLRRQRRHRLGHRNSRVVTRDGRRFLYVLVLVYDRVNVVDEGLSEHGQVLVLVVELLLIVVVVVVRRREPLPAEGVDEKRMLFEVLLERVFLRNYFGIVVVVVDVVVVVVVRIDVVVRVGIGRVVRDSDRWWKGFVFRVVQLLVANVVQSEIARGDRRVDGTPFPGAEAEDGTHSAPMPSHHLPNTFQNHRFGFSNRDSSSPARPRPFRSFLPFCRAKMADATGSIRFGVAAPNLPNRYGCSFRKPSEPSTSLQLANADPTAFVARSIRLLDGNPTETRDAHSLADAEGESRYFPPRI